MSNNCSATSEAKLINSTRGWELLGHLLALRDAILRS
jgi:hypothetical protein